jgi:hypothetical protein
MEIAKSYDIVLGAHNVSTGASRSGWICSIFLGDRTCPVVSVQRVSKIVLAVRFRS